MTMTAAFALLVAACIFLIVSFALELLARGRIGTLVVFVLGASAWLVLLHQMVLE